MPLRPRSRTFLTLLSISALLLALACATLLRLSKKDHLTLSPEENRLFDRLASSSSHTSASHARTARTARDANSNSVSSSPDAAPHALSDAAPPSHMRLSGAANNLGAGASTTLVLVVANKAQAREGCADIIKQIFTASTASASSGLPATKYVTYILTGDNPGLELGTAASAPIERANPQLAKTYQAPGHAFDGPEGIETWREDLQRTGETVAYLVDWPYFKLSFVVYKLASGEGGVDGGGGVVRYRLFLSQCPYAFKQFLASENLPTLPGGETLLAGLAGGSEVAFEALDRSLLDRVKVRGREEK